MEESPSPSGEGFRVRWIVTMSHACDFTTSYMNSTFQSTDRDSERSHVSGFRNRRVDPEGFWKMMRRRTSVVVAHRLHVTLHKVLSEPRRWLIALSLNVHVQSWSFLLIFPGVKNSVHCAKGLDSKPRALSVDETL